MLSNINIPDYLLYNNYKYNLNYDELHNEVLLKKECKLTENNTILVNTGKFTGRCPLDRYIVCNENENSHYHIDWNSINIPIKKSTFDKIFQLHNEYLKTLDYIYIYDGFVGSSKTSRRSVRIITELAWHHHFCTNMFIKASKKELINFKPDIIVLNSNAKFNEWHSEGLRSETCVALDVDRGLQVITGTQYSGEIKKGVFSLMNYLLPLENIMSMHCSATIGINNDVAIFFGLSGTGKTTLSADTTRYLIGDDEHGWDNEGIFNLEGGCYAKMINLDPQQEPLIYSAVKKNAILENVIIDKNGKCDYFDKTITENTRCSYPIEHINNYLKGSYGGHPSNILFLAADAYGVLPPISKLTNEQALYHLISGYTAKVAGTEMGVIEPIATFSICFGGAFMPLPAEIYAKLFEKKIKKHNVNVYLINTGWSGGPYGIGKRMNIDITRSIVSIILNNKIEDNDLNTPDKFFQLRIPKNMEGIDVSILNPRNTWDNKEDYDNTAIKLSNMYIKNWEKFKNNPYMNKISNYGPGGNALINNS